MMKNYIFLLLLFLIYPSEAFSKDYSVNKNGISYYNIENRTYKGFLSVADDGQICLTAKETSWKLSRVDTLFFYLDEGSVGRSELRTRLRATRYLPLSLTTVGLEGRNDDVQWTFVSEGKEGWGYLIHKSTGRYLSADGDKVSVVERKDNTRGLLWKMSLRQLKLDEIESPIIMMGDDNAGFRDPAVCYHEGVFYMYYSYVTTEEEEKIYWYVAMSKSTDLVHWSDPKVLTVKDQHMNFASPGCVIKYGDEWVLCMQTYCMPGYTRKDPIRYGNDDCRVWIMRSKDLENWQEPEMLYVYGPDKELDRMYDAYLVEDKDEKGKWWCFYNPKHGGVGYSWSRDLKTWHFGGKTRCGENVCVWVENDRYLMMHSPSDGMGILESSDFKDWKEYKKPNNLGKKDWPWAGKRVTAGFLLDLRKDKRIGKYLMFFHGQGPAPQSTEIINSGTDLGIAWSDDLETWNWPGKVITF